MKCLLICLLACYIPGFPDASSSPLLIEHNTRRSLRSWRRDRVRLPFFVIPRRSHFRMEPPDADDDDQHRLDPAVARLEPETAILRATAVPSTHPSSMTEISTSSTQKTDAETATEAITSTDSAETSTMMNSPGDDITIAAGYESPTTVESPAVTSAAEADSVTTEISLAQTTWTSATPTTTPREKMLNRLPLPRLEDLFPEQAADFSKARQSAIVATGSSHVYQNPGNTEDPLEKNTLEVVAGVPINATREETPSKEAVEEIEELAGEEMTTSSTSTEADSSSTLQDDLSTELPSDHAFSTTEPGNSITLSPNVSANSERNSSFEETSTITASVIVIDTTTEEEEVEFNGTSKTLE